LAYAAIAAFISAGFLFGVLSLMGGSLLEYRVSTFFLLGMALLAFDPLRQQLQELVGRRLLRDRAGAAELAAALAEEEQRADQASRLAELGAFTSAVAHEVRGPLGVLSAQLHGLRESVDPQSLSEMQAQVRRAEAFVEDLLRYGRPRPLKLRQVDLAPLVELAFSTARQGQAELAEGAVLKHRGLDEGLSLEADQSQLLQVFVILFDNALQALEGRPDPTVHVRAEASEERVTLVVEDNGPGVDPQLLPRVFEPFVTGRKGVGLGLAIARRIVERHKGTISAGRAEPEGARFELQLPRDQRVLAAATGVS
jgi:signal transduction histidine kinase